LAVVVDEARQAEIQDLQVRLVGHAEREIADQKHIVRLEIAVDHALVVSRFDRFAQPLADVNHRDIAEGAELIDVGVQIEPGQVLAHHVLPALRRATNVIRADHAGVLDGSSRLRLALEAHLQVGVHGQVRMQDLDRKALVRQPRMPRLVHSAHAALAQDVAHHVRVLERHADQRIGALGRHGQTGPRRRCLEEGRGLRRPHDLLAVRALELAHQL
jgi:hypothetical protein